MYSNAEKYFFNILKNNGYSCSFEEFQRQRLDAALRSDEEKFMHLIEIHTKRTGCESNELKNFISFIKKVLGKYTKKQFYFSHDMFSVNIDSKKHPKTNKTYVVSFDFNIIHYQPFGVRILYGYKDRMKEQSISFE